MKKQRLFYILLIVCLVLSLASCKSASSDYINVNHENSQVLLEDLKTYINADEKLSGDDKEVRVKSVEQWQKLLQTAYEKNKKE